MGGPMSLLKFESVNENVMVGHEFFKFLFVLYYS